MGRPVANYNYFFKSKTLNIVSIYYTHIEVEYMGKIGKLSQKRLPIRIWVNTGFGGGHYKYIKPIQIGNQVLNICESRDGMQQWNEPLILPTLEKMGLKRLPNGRIINLISLVR
jgi:hypothetical protein